MGHLRCRTKQVLFENEFHMMCCLANSPAISCPAVILILAYNEMILHRMERGGLHLHIVRRNAKCGASFYRGQPHLVLLRPQKTCLDNDPQKLLFICGDLLIAGQMGRPWGEGEELKQLNVADPLHSSAAVRHTRGSIWRQKSISVTFMYTEGEGSQVTALPHKSS